ncbi:MAG TPA: hypothetical protein VG895_05470 [Patescibacteria group bacterium]|nr:hypothetical protein [Patescibacteria group bacterium]
MIEVNSNKQEIKIKIRTYIFPANEPEYPEELAEIEFLEQIKKEKEENLKIINNQQNS